MAFVAAAVEGSQSFSSVVPGCSNHAVRKDARMNHHAFAPEGHTRPSHIPGLCTRPVT